MLHLRQTNSSDTLVPFKYVTNYLKTDKYSFVVRLVKYYNKVIKKSLEHKKSHQININNDCAAIVSIIKVDKKYTQCKN